MADSPEEASSNVGERWEEWQNVHSNRKCTETNKDFLGRLSTEHNNIKLNPVVQRFSVQIPKRCYFNNRIS